MENKMAKKFKFIFSYLFITVLMLQVFIPELGATSIKARVVDRSNTTNKVVALTFDGEDGANEGKILKILANNNIKATFFVTGQEAEKYPQIIREIARQGHQLGNHSYSHRSLTGMSSKEAIDELRRTEKIIRRNVYRYRMTIPVRPPYGQFNDSLLQAMGESGFYSSVIWSVETYDWQGRNAQTIVNTVNKEVTPGAIILMHASKSAVNTPEAVDIIIKSLKIQGYEFVTIDQLLRY